MHLYTSMKSTSLLLLVSLFSSLSYSQKNARIEQDRCGTMIRLEKKFEENPQFRIRFEQQKNQFNKVLKENILSSINDGTGIESTNRTVLTIPVVFHVVLDNQSLVTDAQIQAQLDTLNKDFFGSNADSVKIPSYFKAVFGKSDIQFCLAKQTPDGDVTTGIDRVTTNQSSFGVDDAMKHVFSNGADIWDPSKYLNVWICALNNSLLGYSTFPTNTDASEDGVVIDYRSMPDGSYNNFNTGKTLTHETGHYFNLTHIWGDDDGGCNGSDDVDDTPNQANSTSGCLSGIVLDACTASGNGIMYQNYMDYSTDNCMVMFSAGQVVRMEAALAIYRSSLLLSNACITPIPKDFDAQIRSINQPAQRICTPSFSPTITIKNRGMQMLTSLIITTKIDNGATTTFNWTGSLAPSASIDISLNNLTTTTGNHILTITVSDPNNISDQDPTNNILTLNFQYYPAVTTVSESFESSAFPPTGWDIVNPDNLITWQRTTAVAKTGIASAMINNINNMFIRQKDDLRLPTISLSSSLDSAFLSFQVAAATYTSTSASGNHWDTLEVLVSTDCGQTYSSLYKKWGANLVTSSIERVDPFFPTPSQWRKDSVNLGNYIGNSNLLVAFRNTTGYENNIFIDDVNLRTVTVNPNLKAKGFLVTPNPTRNSIAVQFYPPPVNLKAVELFNSVGQKINEVMVSGVGNTNYAFDLSSYAAGTYMVRVVFTDHVEVRRIIKY